MAKQLIFDDEARHALLNGVDQLANTVNEAVNILNPAAGTWLIGVYGYNVKGDPYFTGTLS